MSESFQIFTNQYTQKIRSPQWKSFARKMRTHKGGFCELCKRSDIELQVHHWAYEKEREITDYDASEVAILCFACHMEYHKRLQEFRRYIFPRLTPRSFQVINGALAAALLDEDPLTVGYAIAELISTKGAVKRLAAAWAASSRTAPVVEVASRSQATPP